MQLVDSELLDLLPLHHFHDLVDDVVALGGGRVSLRPRPLLGLLVAAAGGAKRRVSLECELRI